MIFFVFMLILLVDFVVIVCDDCVGCWVFWWVLVYVVMWLLLGIVEIVLGFGVFYVVVCMVMCWL